MPKRTLRDTPGEKPATMMARSAPAEANLSKEKEEKSNKMGKGTADSDLKFGALVDDDLEPEGTNLEDIPEDKNPLLDRSIQSKLLPAHVLARVPKTGTSAMSVQKTQNSCSTPVDAPENLNDRNPEMKVETPPEHSKRAKSSETYVAAILKTSKKDGQKVQEHSMRATVPDEVRSRELGNH